MASCKYWLSSKICKWIAWWILRRRCKWDNAPWKHPETEFDVVLKDIGPNKIAIIKVVREATGLGLAEAKKAVEAMGVIKENAPKADAEALVAKLKENGATAELK